ncbi:MAG: hypothetical protein HQL31_08260, partial [Planctomycetes bacterium]|nr:hypothetical protein [Planctomycetota bacterium]
FSPTDPETGIPDPVTTSPQAPIELPPFCTWAPELCEYIEWMKQPVDLPEVDPSGGMESPGEPPALPAPDNQCQCPEPYQLVMFGETYQITFQPFCDLATMIKPLFLALIWIMFGWAAYRQVAGGT